MRPMRCTARSPPSRGRCCPPVWRWPTLGGVAGALSCPKLRVRIAEPSREELRTMPIIQQTWAQSQTTAGRMQTHGVIPARSVSTHPSRSAAAPTRRPDRGFGR